MMKQGKIKTPGVIGIDAGGTYTDLVFLNSETNSVLARAKTQTLHDNLVKTIETGLDLILDCVDVSAICSFNLATTLATNAIVENKLRRTALILIGYNETIVRNAVNANTFNTKDVSVIRGGHDQQGNEKEALDEAALREAILNFSQNIEAVAVSSFFSVRNTDHENKAVQVIQQLRPDLYISCGHELSTDLDAMKRATTTTLNAGLIPIVMELLASVENVCCKRNITVPITIVRGDGTIVGAPWARQHPVEMVLSGPAASACGARFLASTEADERVTFVVDIGGTTTDIIHLDEKGKPVLLEEGATVAGHQTLIKAIDIYTFGLGGDTRVIYNDKHNPELASRRVRPLCSLGHARPDVVQDLKILTKKGFKGEPLFLLAGFGEPKDEFEERILDQLKGGPRSVELLLSSENARWLKYRQIEKMEERGLVQYASFTPTDALHVLGLLDIWNVEASRLGARVMARGGSSAEDIAARVKEMATVSIGKELMRQNLEADDMELEQGGEGERMLEYALLEPSHQSKLLLVLNTAFVGVGAPSWAFIPAVGECLHESAVLPEHGDIAGAVGAAVGSFSLLYSVRISPLDEQKKFRVHYPLGIADFENLEAAIEYACAFMQPWLSQRALKAGANHPQVSVDRHDKIVPINGGGSEIYLYTQLSFEVTDAD